MAFPISGFVDGNTVQFRGSPRGEVHRRAQDDLDRFASYPLFALQQRYGWQVARHLRNDPQRTTPRFIEDSKAKPRFIEENKAQVHRREQSPGSSKTAKPMSIEENNPQVHRRKQSPCSSKRTKPGFIEDSKAQVHRRKQSPCSSQRTKPMFMHAVRLFPQLRRSYAVDLVLTES